MGIFDRLLGRPEKKKRYRGPSRPAAEREKAEELRYMRELRGRDRMAYDEMMRKRLGIANAGRDQIDELAETVTKLKKLGIIKGAGDIGEGSSLVRDIMGGLGLLMQMGGGGFPIQITTNSQPAAVQEAPQPQPQAVEPARIAPPPAQDTNEEEKMSLMSTFAIGQLNGKTPEQAAQWLLSQPYPQARQLVQQILATPDEQIIPLLNAVASQYPDFAGLVNWLRSQPQWLMGVVRAVRQLSGAVSAEDTITCL
ncbi:MAG: hypothetical protein M0T85_01770 [Dehalococcoidales bacterium]|nr:hypothetical protein [Dehalococcoidales bacterium]